MTRDTLIQARVSAAEARLALRLATQRGIAIAQLVRELIRREGSRMVVNAWTVKAGDDNGARQVVNTRPFYRLAVQNMSANGRELSAEVYEAAGGGFIGPCGTVAFGQSEWYRCRDDHRFVLQGSGLWRISNVIDVESMPEGRAHKSAVLFLEFERPTSA